MNNRVTQNINVSRTHVTFHIDGVLPRLYFAILNIAYVRHQAGKEVVSYIQYNTHIRTGSITQIEKSTAFENRCPLVLPFVTSLSHFSVQ